MYALNYKTAAKTARPFMRVHTKAKAKAKAKKIAKGRGRIMCVFKEKHGAGGETYLTKIACYKP